MSACLFAAAYGEVSVLRKKSNVGTKRGRDGTTPSKTTIRVSKCQRVVAVDCGDGEFSVELKRKAIGETARVLLGTR